MKLILEPTRSRHAVTYTADGDTVTATVNGVVEVFDFSGSEDGDYRIEPPESGDLPIATVSRASRIDGVLTVYATHHFGAPPVRALIGTGDEAVLEPEAEYAERLAAYEAGKQVREVEL
ncbi:hypothetical protein BTW08_15955 [Salinicola sp. MH3R3-1]|nr:hypothetical protein BTW08_15955 [Salinicola sp. MH3R3-1]